MLQVICSAQLCLHEIQNYFCTSQWNSTIMCSRYPIETWNHLDDVLKRERNDFRSKWDIVYGVFSLPVLLTIITMNTSHPHRVSKRFVVGSAYFLGEVRRTMTIHSGMDFGPGYLTHCKTNIINQSIFHFYLPVLFFLPEALVKILLAQIIYCTMFLIWSVALAKLTTVLY